MIFQDFIVAVLGLLGLGMILILWREWLHNKYHWQEEAQRIQEARLRGAGDYGTVYWKGKGMAWGRKAMARKKP